MSGYAGKILRINLTSGEISELDTSDYEEWGGGHGMGSAIFWEKVIREKQVDLSAIDGFHEDNVVTIMTSPLTGTLVPGASARTEVQGIGVQTYPFEWFTRSGFGGRFGPMLKFAGWDGIVIEGQADSPVWIDIRDGEVEIRDASTLWGLDTRVTQEKVWEEVSGGTGYGSWVEVGPAGNGRKSTQRPAVLTVGPAGEQLCRVASLIHDAGNGSGQGGFGGVWGSKKLKAISVIGTGTIPVANPESLLETRRWALENFTFSTDEYEPSMGMWATMPSNFRSFPSPLLMWQRTEQCRPQACFGCQAGCRCRYDPGYGNESSCKESGFYTSMAMGGQQVSHLASLQAAAGSQVLPLQDLAADDAPDVSKQAADLAQRLGINTGELETGIPYLRELYMMGVLGPGKQIECDLPFDRFGEYELVEQLLTAIAKREGIGDDIAEGFTRAAQRWGRLEEDLQTGILNNCHWGIAMHYDPRVSLEWGYGTVLDSRDINEHGFCPLYMIPTLSQYSQKGQPVPAEEFAKIFSERMVPYDDDPLMLDFSNANMYSEHVAKLVAWHRHYSRFWIQSVLFCDLQFPDFFNWAAQDYRGITGEGEPRFFEAVTGRKLDFADSIEIGRKIWNLDNAIWTLQGRHRDAVQLADYVYELHPAEWAVFTMPVNENGEWTYGPIGERSIDRTQFEEFKTRYYGIEGWDPGTGWPTRSTLESLGLGTVADELENKGKLGQE
jgi:aldehyde:ferredoxin oxidoreductase